jgi:predicted ATPase
VGRGDEAERRPADATPIAIVSPPPVPLTSLVGRRRELADLEELVAARRLVTLTGVGGSGKTRLATELALRLDGERPGSVAWVELGRCAEAGLVAPLVGAALSLRPMQGGDLLLALVTALRDRQLLLVLDDCEHLVDAVAAVAGTLLQRCPGLRIVATSREPLGVAGEHIWLVPPVSAEEGARLFAERAGAVDPGFDPRRRES